jgi:three-Cys-motif partner protein
VRAQCRRNDIVTEELDFTPDEIGEWSERKIRIVARHAEAYSKILAKQNYLKHFYIDGFCGGGIAVRKGSRDHVLTTARRILAIKPPFTGYHMIDADAGKAAAMQLACGQQPGAVAHCGDANALLPPIMRQMRHDQYRRALCFLDPYKILLDWNVLVEAARMKTIETFIHFPTGDIQRNVLRHDQSTVDPTDVARMNLMWGDDSWRKAAFVNEPDLFGDREVKAPIDSLLSAFADRLRKVAGFAHVSKPLPMRNKTNAIIYHLIFATPNATGLRIANHILKDESTPKV